MTTRVDVEDIVTTKSEKLLAVVLTTFVLIGLLWVYFHVDVERDRVATPVTPSASDRAALDQRDDARIASSRSARRLDTRRRQLVEAREAYRTALDAGTGAADLARRYEASQAELAEARRQRGAARRALVAAGPAARAAERRIERADAREQERIDEQERHDGRVSAVRRLALLVCWLGASYALLGWLRRRRSRWLLAGMAAVAAVALLALVMAIDYLTDYVDITNLGVLVLSISGVLMTIGAFAVLQRYLARRLPERRVRRGECPFCGYPARENAHCEGCGRDVVGDCTACHASRRVGTRHCRACGAS